MRKKLNLLFVPVMIAGMILGCTQTEEVKSPIEGAWKMIYGNWISVEGTYPADIGGGQIKMFTEKYYSHVGQFKMDTIYDNHGCGTYTLNGSKFEEKIIYRYNGSDQGTIKKLLLDVSNDTLTLRWPVNDSWELAENYNIEKYIRLD